MGTYIFKRLLAMIPTLLGVAVLIFVLLSIGTRLLQGRASTEGRR